MGSWDHQWFPWRSNQSLMEIWRCFCWPPISISWCFSPDLSAFNHQPPQEATRDPAFPRITWVSHVDWKGFFSKFHLHRILVLLLYILQHRKIMSRCLDQNGIFLFFLAGVEKSLSASIVYQSTAKVVVKAALCPVDDIKYEKVGWWRGPHVICCRILVGTD